MKRLFLFLAPFLMSLICTQAQTLQLAHEFIPGNGGGYPQLMTIFNNQLYMSAEGANMGRELWRYNGTTATVAAEINPGAGSGLSSYAFQKMAVLGGKLYFPGYTDTTGTELMVYDGSTPPSVVADLFPGVGTSYPYALRAIGGKLYFTAETPGMGYELYVYDGVNPPSSFDLKPGIIGSNPQEFTAYNNKVYFRAENVAAGEELWVYDPVADTAYVAADIAAMGASSSPFSLTVYNGKLYFRASTDTFGAELWRYDGINATRLTDIGPGTRDGIQGGIVVYNNALYFSGNQSGPTGDLYQLYKYDPATTNSSLVHVIDAALGLPITNFTVHKNKLYFTAVTSAAGFELWMHDGTNTGMVVDFNPGAASSGINELTEYNQELYMGAMKAPATENELYRLTDATGIQQAGLRGSVCVAPNPVGGDAMLSMDLEQAYTCAVTLTDATGRVVWQLPARSYAAGARRVVLPMGAQAPGVYFYYVFSEGKVMATGRVVRR